MALAFIVFGRLFNFVDKKKRRMFNQNVKSTEPEACVCVYVFVVAVRTFILRVNGALLLCGRQCAQ